MWRYVIPVMLWTYHRRRKADRQYNMLSTHLKERCMIYTTGANVKVKTEVLNDLLLMDLLEDINNSVTSSKV